MNEQKEIYASIEIGDHEVRLVAGEFYETRFHILRVERCELQGIEHKLIVDEQAVVAAIRKAVHKEYPAPPLHIFRLMITVYVQDHIAPEAYPKYYSSCNVPFHALLSKTDVFHSHRPQPNQPSPTG